MPTQGEIVGSSGTLTGAVFEKLRRELVTGVWRPGERLRADVLGERYGVGASPVREALNRLSAERLVVQLDQRGFRVAPISRDDLFEITRTRCWIDEIGVRESIAHGDETWEEGIILAFHRLVRIQETDVASGRLSEEWERRHRLFHGALVGACRSSWLVDFSLSLYDCFDRYRFLSTGAIDADSSRHDGADREHRALMEAAVSRRADDAVAMLRQHFTETANSIARLIDFDSVGPEVTAAALTR